MYSTQLNPDHKIQYFSDPDVTVVLKGVRKFIKEDEIDNVSNIQVQMHWDEETQEVRYDAWLIHGGF